MTKESKIIVVITTSDTEDELHRIGETLVEEGLAACAQVDGPIISHYIWQGKKKRSREWQLKIKTLASKYNAVEKAIKDSHSYEVPQIVAVPVCAVFEPFAHWVESALS